MYWPKWALSTLFFVDGAGYGFWASHVPVFKQNLALSNGALSIVLLSVVAGAVVAMPIMGQLIAQFGSRTVIRVVAVSYVATIALLAEAGSFGALVVFATLFGAAKGAFDVSANAQAITIEHDSGVSSMSLLQGCWSVGGLLGAGSASLWLHHGSTLRIDLFSAAWILGFCVLLVLPLLVAEDLVPRPKKHHGWTDPELLSISILAFLGLFAEGAIGDWAAVYLRSILGITLSVAAAGFAVYAISMAGARFVGDWLGRHFTSPTILRCSGLLFSIGFGIVLSSRSWKLSIFGLILTGAGVANIFPVIVTVASRDTKLETGSTMSVLTTIGYLGLLAGPPLIGGLAVQLGLGFALSLVVLAGLLVATGPFFITMNKPTQRMNTNRVNANRS